LQNATITKQNMRINILESSGLAKPEELIMNKSFLNSVHFFDVLYNSPTCFSYKVLYKSISINRHTDTNEILKTERDEENVPAEMSQRGGSLYDVLRHIKGSLGSDALGEDGGLGDVEFQTSILLEDMLEFSQDLKQHAQLDLDITIIRVLNHPGLLCCLTTLDTLWWNFPRTRPHKWCIVKLIINISKGSPC
jgi:hypothetical protein